MNTIPTVSDLTHWKDEWEDTWKDEWEDILKDCQKKEQELINMDGLIEGRIVHYVMPNGNHRPAIVIRVWRFTHDGVIQDPPANGCCQLHVFLDSINDRDIASEQACQQGFIWATSILYSEESIPGTWHWTEKA